MFLFSWLHGVGFGFPKSCGVYGLGFRVAFPKSCGVEVLRISKLLGLIWLQDSPTISGLPDPKP